LSKNKLTKSETNKQQHQKEKPTATTIASEGQSASKNQPDSTTKDELKPKTIPDTLNSDTTIMQTELKKVPSSSNMQMTLEVAEASTCSTPSGSESHPFEATPPRTKESNPQGKSQGI
jgi:hypothetical protein